MGQAVATLVEQQDDLSLAGIWARGEDLDALLNEADVLIDFSLPEATGDVLQAASRCDVPLVCGVSGLDEAQLSAISDASKSLAVVYDRNMSLGVAVLERCVAAAAAALGADFNVQIDEVHHVHKKDAPSGTALKLGEAIAAVRNDLDSGSIRYEVERRDEVPGDHAVTMASATERLTFGHSVTTRVVFAEGAVRAARWVAGQQPGYYSMQDVLFGVD
ncbi:MAG: 4-hydroxy-tetrahydrodipicolinate reductase [Gammaproteobacteria bacterium]|nr:4-hydroxy-tetrahydrodipicolinate reductase [Gammaproteobacteria bacterium]